MTTQFLVGAANSGAGKTTITIGLLRAFKDMGMRVQSFKCGPDYIDTKYHAAATKTEPVNLDTWMASAKHVRDLYYRYASESNCCITEGVMGLFDGYKKMCGSSAEIAGLLKIPVVLVVNAVSTAYSVAPVIYGFMHFHPEVRIAGVIFNKVSSASHFSFLKEACNDINVECFGYMPMDKDISIPSRHLGLSTSEDIETECYIRRIAELVKENIDLDKMIRCLSAEIDVDIENNSLSENEKHITIAVARDEAFNFTYRENIDRLALLANVVFFSPLHDHHLPKADILYIPGGYPELYAEGLEKAEMMRHEIRIFADNGGKIFAECGGLMYMCGHLENNGKKYEMTGIMPFDCSMTGARLTLGYRYMTYKGKTYRGHEFHYSHISDADALPSMADLYNARDMKVPVRIYRKGNVIAGYTHWYWGENDFMDFWK